MDLHNLPGGVPSQVSQGLIALTFLRSTCPWGGGWKSSFAGSYCPYGENIVQLLRAWIVMSYFIAKRVCESCIRQPPVDRVAKKLLLLARGRSSLAYDQVQKRHELTCNKARSAIVFCGVD